MKQSKVLAIDFDQVIHDKLHPIIGRRMGQPFPDAKIAIDTLRRNGYSVIIHTTMANTAGGKKAVADWLEYYDIRHDGIEPKVTADLYIDDKAVHHTDWSTTIHEIETRTR